METNLGSVPLFSICEAYSQTLLVLEHRQYTTRVVVNVPSFGTLNVFLPNSTTVVVQEIS